MEPKLGFELVPDGCWYLNLRSLLPPAGWDAVRKAAYARAGGKCSVCGVPCKRLEAHERWGYDIPTKTQKLEDVVALCPACHSVVHIGRTQLKGDARAAEEHFMKVNGATYAEFRKSLGEANERHRELNRVDEWALDLSKLKDLI